MNDGQVVLTAVRTRGGRLLTRGQSERSESLAPAAPISEPAPVRAGLVGAAAPSPDALGPRAAARVRRLAAEPDLGHATSRIPRQAQLDGFDLRANVWVPARSRPPG